MIFNFGNIPANNIEIFYKIYSCKLQCNLLIPEVAETAIVLLMMGGIVTRNM